MGDVHSANCVECTICNNDAVAATPAGCQVAGSDSRAAKSTSDTVTSIREKKDSELANFGRTDDRPGCPFDWRDTAENKRGRVAMNVKFETTAQEIAVELTEMREFLLHVIIRTLLFQTRNECGLLIVNFRKIRVMNESGMLIRIDESVEETWLKTITPEEPLPVITESRQRIEIGVIFSCPVPMEHVGEVNIQLRLTMTISCDPNCNNDAKTLFKNLPTK
jgi:hypothetical protein